MSDPVQATIQRTQERLSTSLRDWWVTPNDLRSIARDFDALTPAQRNRAMAGLSEANLDTLAGEMMQSRPLVGGLGTGERRDFFDDLARGLDGQQLGRLAGSFARTDGQSDGFTPVGELARSVADHGGTQAKLDFIRQLAPQTTDNPSHTDTGLGYSSTVYADSQASAVATVLGSLGGQAATQGLAALSNQQLDAVVNSSVQGTTFHSSLGIGMGAGPGPATINWDASRFGELMDAAASARSIGGAGAVNATEQQARVFNAAGRTLAGVDDTNSVLGGLVVTGKDATITQMTGGMTRLLESDTTGITANLAYDERSFGGQAMTAYAKGLLDTGQSPVLGEVMSRLQLGNDGTANAVERLEQQVDLGSGRTRNANAGALGYFTGSVYAATTQVSADVAAQQEMVTNVLKSALTVVDKTQPWGRPVGIAASVAKEWVAMGVRGVIADEGAAPAQRLERAALPYNPQGDLAVSDAAFSAFNDRIVQVERANR